MRSTGRTHQELLLAIALFITVVNLLVIGIVLRPHSPRASICHAERSDTREGVELIQYPPNHPITRPGVVVTCPSK